MKLALVFPGQGSQSVGMLQGYSGVPGVHEAIEEAKRILGAPFMTLLDQGPAEQLELTVNTQPAMLTAGHVAYVAWRALGGPEPEVVAGHSLGEYTALVAAGALRFADALPLVRFRAQAMQEAVPQGEGAMAAILALDEDKVRQACSEAGGVAQAVNFNSPEQIVIAGEKAAVQRACERCIALGAKRAVPLPVSTLPGPHSKTWVTPCVRIARMVSTQRTGDEACRTSASLIASGERATFTSTLLTSPTRGGAIVTLAR